MSQYVLILDIVGRVYLVITKSLIMFIRINNQIVNTCLLQSYIRNISGEPDGKTVVGLYAGEDMVVLKEYGNYEEAVKELDTALTCINNCEKAPTNKVPEIFILS